MTWFAAANGQRGRSPKFPDAAIQFGLTFKILFGLALRQTTGLAQSVLQPCGTFMASAGRADTLHYDDETLDSVIGDDAYDAQFVHEAVIRRAASPFIPPRKNARIRKGKCVEHRMRLLLHAGDWGKVPGNAGSAINDDVWWKFK